MITGSMAGEFLWHVPPIGSCGHVACIQAWAVVVPGSFNCREICSDFPLGTVSLSYLHWVFIPWTPGFPELGEKKKSPFSFDQGMVVFPLVSMAQLFFFLPHEVWHLLSTCIPKFPDISSTHKAFYEA